MSKILDMTQMFVCYKIKRDRIKFLDKGGRTQSVRVCVVTTFVVRTSFIH